jgi:NAD-reducing hydrogenase large subunit
MPSARRREFVDTRPAAPWCMRRWPRTGRGMIEMLHAHGGHRRAARRPGAARGDLVATGPRAHEGVGVIEAPRGTLIHHYRVGDDDRVQMCNLIVSTTHNNQAMNEAVRAVARERFDGREITEGLLNEIEVAIRAYDPCLSCATHALGSMPIEVTLVRVDGTSLDRLRRDGDGRIVRG